MSEDISKIISKYKLYMSFNGNEYQMIEKVELNKTFEEIERLNNIIDKVREYIQDRYDGEVLTHTFDKDNVGELLEILGSDKE